jgi:hypothetical protein
MYGGRSDSTVVSRWQWSGLQQYSRTLSRRNFQNSITPAMTDSSIARMTGMFGVACVPLSWAQFPL